MERNWSNLPNEICESILNRLCVINIAAFKSVCRGWYYATQESSILSLLKPVPSPPWLTIPNSSSDNNSKQSYYEVTNNKLHHTNVAIGNGWRGRCYSASANNLKASAVCIGSCHGWLAFIDFRCVMYLINPFTLATIQLPPIETLPDIISSSLSPIGDGSVDFKYRGHVLDDDQVSSHDMIDYYLVKLVMSSAPSFQETTMIMIIYGYHHYSPHLAVCRLGDNSWTPLDGKLVSYADDLYYSDTTHQFYVICNKYHWTVEVWDLSDFSSPKRSCIDFPVVHGHMSEAEKTLIDGCFPKKYLAELYGNLLVVVKHCFEDESSQSYKTIYFAVYELDLMKKEWINIKSLGDNGEGVLFLGINNAMTFSACDFLGLQHSSIYFTDDFDERHLTQDCTGHDLGVFNLRDNSIHSLYYHGDIQEVLPPPVWISPNPW